MRHLTFVTALLLLIVLPVQAQTTELPPYIYYFSDNLNAIVIERADGTDSRMLGQGLMPPGIASISGPGWSPSGEWFAWESAYKSEYGEDTTDSGYAVKVDGNAYFSGKERGLTRVWHMEWAPTSDRNILLILSGFLSQSDALTSTLTYWLVDVDLNKVLAIYNPNNTGEGRGPSLLQWVLDEGYVTFYLYEYVSAADFSTYVRITLYLNGTVKKELIDEPIQTTPHYEYQEGFIDPETGFQLSPGFVGDPRITISPSGRYRIESVGPESTLIDTVTGQHFDLPVHTESTRGEHVFNWHPSEKWIFRGDSVLLAGGHSPYRRLGITNLYGTLWRQLGGCYFNATCLGWLPEQVDIQRLPPSAPESVLFAPLEIYVLDTMREYTSRPIPNATLRCDADNNWLLIQDHGDGHKPGSPLQLNRECADPGKEERVVVAIHPDHSILVMCWGYSFASVWELASGRLLTTLNTGGLKMFFNADGSRLYTYEMGGILVWDVDKILARYATPQ
ncbi:MAG TPA: hypothetical protein VHO69_11530 [Phototrophicaceae bacterium]|nr:hypothetical protein [Phototrophicaceae bacterium]